MLTGPLLRSELNAPTGLNNLPPYTLIYFEVVARATIIATEKLTRLEEMSGKAELRDPFTMINHNANVRTFPSTLYNQHPSPPPRRLSHQSII